SWRSSAPTPVSTSTCRFGNKVHEHPSWLSGWRRPVDAHRSGGLRADRQHRVTVEYLLRPECVVAVGVGDGPDDLPVDLQAHLLTGLCSATAQPGGGRRWTLLTGECADQGVVEDADIEVGLWAR